MKKLTWRRTILLFCILSSTTLIILLILFIKSNPQYYYEELHLSPKMLNNLLTEVEMANTKRVHQVEDTCRKYHLGRYKNNSFISKFKYPPTPQYSVYYFDREHQIAYCPVYKAGSTTWLYNLCVLNGEKYFGGKQISEVARAIFPELDGEKAEMQIPESKKLLCVRHPFDRLLSAYRDKLENKDRAPEQGTLHYYKRWGSKIRNKFRTSGKLEPTFEEFAKYLIETDLLAYADDHWIPYNAYCTPCLTRYDYIAKVETLTYDQLFFIYREHLTTRISPSKHHSSNKISSYVAKEYYSQITKEQVKSLYEKYQLDFEMFNYSINPYLEYAKQ